MTDMVLTIIAYHFFLQGVDVFYSDAPLPGVRGKRCADELPSGSGHRSTRLPAQLMRARPAGSLEVPR